MVIKILSMHIPLSLNTALSVTSLVSPPSSQRFQVQFFVLCPAYSLSPLRPVLPLEEADWTKVSRINKGRRPLARGRICDSWVPPHPEPHPRLRRAVRWLKLRKPETSQWKREGKRKRGREREREKKKIERATDWSGGSELCSLAWTLRSCCRQEDKFVSLRRWLSHTVVVSHPLKKGSLHPKSR